MIKSVLGARFLLGGQLVPAGLSFATLIVCSKYLGPGGRGSVAFIQSTASLVVAIGGFSLFIDASLRSSAAIGKYLWTTFLLTGACCVGALAIALIWSPGLMTPRTSIVIALVALPSALTLFCQRISQARVGDREYFLIGTVPMALLSATLTVVVVSGGDLRAYLTTLIVVGLSSLVFALYRLRRIGIPFLQADTESCRSILRRSYSVGIAGISSILLVRGDTVALGAASNAVEVGNYALASSISGISFFVAEVYHLRMTSRIVQGPLEYHSRDVDALVHSALKVSVVLIIPLALFGSILIYRALPEFKPAIPSLAILSIATVPICYVRLRVTEASLTNSVVIWKYSAASLLIALAYLPLAYYGAIALAFGSLIGYSIVATFLWFARRRTSDH